MPQKKEQERLNDLRKFVKYTWEVVSRNPEYRQDYIDFLKANALTPDDVKERVEEGRHIVPRHPGR